MASEKLQLYTKVLRFFFFRTFKLLQQRAFALHHRWTYQALPSAKNIVVVGGSFVGVQLARRLSESVPTGYRVVMVEKNSHLNYLFAFPRFAVIPGHERQAFIPYDGLARAAPAGAFSYVQDTVTHISAEHVYLSSGDPLEYAYLAIATGSAQALPSKVSATEREEACEELRSVQEKIQAAQRIAVVGGGAVGVEIASDIKSFFPGKDVTLVHSRPQLLSHFGTRLHEHASAELTKMGVRLVLQERPEILPGQISLRFADDRIEEFDLVIPCTGQNASSGILTDLAPECVSKDTHRILVEPTLQLKDSKYSNIFALGDVAETLGPKMARAGLFQAEIVLANILEMIKGLPPSDTYKPLVSFEGAIKLTLGKTAWVMYSPDGDKGLIFAGNNGKEDLDIEGGWKYMNMKLTPERS